MPDTRRLPLLVAGIFGAVIAVLDVVNVRVIESGFFVWAISRYGLVYFGAVVIGVFGGSTSLRNWIVLVFPTAVVLHGLLLSDMSGDVGLWPLLFIADAILLIVCLPLISLGRATSKRLRKRVEGK